MPIKIDFLSNVRQFLRGTDDAEQALDDVADSLDDMADAAKKGGRDAERSVENLEDSFRDAARRAKDLGDAGKDAGRDVERGMKDAESGVENLKDEANSTAREAAASFDGSAESIAGAFQEVAANAFAGFGPAGAVAGLAAAAGIGLAIAGFEDVAEAEQESRERAAEWAQAFVDAGGKVLNAATKTAKAIDIATDPEKYKTAEENAKNWGVSVGTAIAAMSGETWALNAANDALSASEAKISGEMADVGIQFDWTKKSMSDLSVETHAGRKALDDLNREMDMGARQAADLSESLRRTATTTEGAILTVDEFGDTVATLPDGTTIYIDAETGQATTDVNAIEKKIYGIKDKTVDVNVRTNLAWASAQYNKWIRDHDGKSIKIYGRYITPPGAENW